jgi:hypothetical protein
MASRKRTRRPFSSSHSRLLLEILEDRVVFSAGNPVLAPPNLLGQPASSASLALVNNNGLIPVPMANGGTAWLQGPSALGLTTPASATPAQGHQPPSQQPTPSDPGVILGNLPVASPIELSGPQQTVGLAGYIPQQLQTAYGLSTGTSYNNNITFGGIKGDGAGETIGIFEEGYNPAFVDTSASDYNNSALAQFDKEFGLPDPPSLTSSIIQVHRCRPPTTAAITPISKTTAQVSRSRWISSGRMPWPLGPTSSSSAPRLFPTARILFKAWRR